MSGNQDSSQYSPPELTEYGSIESITEQVNKEGVASDQWTENTPLLGSVQPAPT